MTMFLSIRRSCIFLISIFSCLSSYEGNFEKIQDILVQFSHSRTSHAHIQRIVNGVDTGFTNANYKVRLEADTYFVRCNLGKDEILGNSLLREWQCISLAAAAGLAPKTIFHNAAKGILVTEFIETHGREIDLRNRASMQEFCYLVRTLHALPVEFPTHFCPFDTIEKYVKSAKEVGAELPQVILDTVLPAITPMKQTMGLNSKKVPCHLDLHHGNALHDGKRMWLIDWEYSAMGDPMFDLATAASVEDFSDAEMAQFLEVYLERVPTQEEIDTFYRMRILADARWALWYYLQAKISPLSVDHPFTMWGDLLLQHCLDRIIRLEKR